MSAPPLFLFEARGAQGRSVPLTAEQRASAAVAQLKETIDEWAFKQVMQRIPLTFLYSGDGVDTRDNREIIGDADNAHTELAKSLGYLDDAVNWMELGRPDEPEMSQQFTDVELASFYGSPLFDWLELFLSERMNAARRVEVIIYIVTRYLPSPAWRQTAPPGDRRKKHVSYLFEENREYLTDLVLFLLEFGVSEDDLLRQEQAIYDAGVLSGNRAWYPLYDPQVFERLNDLFEQAHRPPVGPDDPGGLLYRREQARFAAAQRATQRPRIESGGASSPTDPTDPTEAATFDGMLDALFASKGGETKGVWLPGVAPADAPWVGSPGWYRLGKWAYRVTGKYIKPGASYEEMRRGLVKEIEEHLRRLMRQN